jgi:hypothetical protein
MPLRRLEKWLKTALDIAKEEKKK